MGYTPFEVGGRATSVVTTVVIEFPKGLPLTLEDRVKEVKQKMQFDQFDSDLLACSLQTEKGQLVEAIVVQEGIGGLQGHGAARRILPNGSLHVHGASAARSGQESRSA